MKNNGVVINENVTENRILGAKFRGSVLRERMPVEVCGH